MQFKPKSENEIKAMQLWPAGEYDFEVIKAEPASSGPNSKAPGTPFIKLELHLFNEHGHVRKQRAILHPAMEVQLRHFCEETGKIDLYDAGTLEAHDCLGAVGKLKLKQKDDEQYGPKNEVADWGAKKKKAVNLDERPKMKPATKQDPCPDDSMPF